MTYTSLATGITTTTYTATSLTKGASYKFKVAVRNAYGYSVSTAAVTILAAQIPAVPAAPVTAFNSATGYVSITFTAPDNGGSAITSYSI